MRSLMAFLAFTIVCAGPARAQDCCPRIEGFVGYSYLNADRRVDRILSESLNSRQGQHGIGFNVAGNFSNTIGVVGDFSFHRREVTRGAAEIDSSTVSFLFGPRFYARDDDATSFFHAMAGGVRRRTEVRTVEASDTDFALAFGGGFEIGASRSVAIRLFQFDYIPARGEDATRNGDKRWNHNYRFQIGVVIRGGGYTK